MFDPQRLLGSLLNGGMSSSSSSVTDQLTRSLGIPTGAGALALLGGVAAGAFEHFSQQRRSQSSPVKAPGYSAPQTVSSSPQVTTAAVSPPPVPELSSAAPPPPPPGVSAVPPPPPPTTGFDTAPLASPPAQETADQLALTLIRAMISAAKADGVIDDSERQRILERLASASDEERAFVAEEMAKPLDLDALIAEVNEPMIAVEVYTASILAIDLDTTAEVKYLKQLARGVGLDAATVNGIHDQAGVIRIYA